MQMAVFPELASLLVWHLQYLPFLYAHAAMHYPWGITFCCGCWLCLLVSALLFYAGIDCACWPIVSGSWCFWCAGVGGWLLRTCNKCWYENRSWNIGFISSLAQPWSCRGFQMSFVISSPPPLSQRYAAVLVFFDIDFIMLLVSKFLQYL